MNTRVDTAVLYYILSIAMSELRARNVKPSKVDVKDVSKSVEDKVSGTSSSALRADEQVTKNVKKAEQGGYVRSLVAVLALLAVGFFGVRVSSDRKIIS